MTKKMQLRHEDRFIERAPETPTSKALRALDRCQCEVHYPAPSTVDFRQCLTCRAAELIDSMTRVLAETAAFAPHLPKDRNDKSRAGRPFEGPIYSMERHGIERAELTGEAAREAAWLVKRAREKVW